MPIGAFNQEKALVVAFFVIVKSSCILRGPSPEALCSALRQCDSWRQGDSTSARHDRRPLHGGDPGHVGPRAGRHAGHRALGARAGGHVYRHRAQRRARLPRLPRSGVRWRQ